MNLIHRVALEHVILGDQTFGAFGEENLMAELERRTHLAALDEISVRLEDRINLLSRRHLFAIENAAARLVDHARAEIAIMRDLVAQGLDLQGGQRVLAAHPGSIVKRRPGSSRHLFGNRDQRPVARNVSRSSPLTLPARHALYLVHAPMGGARAVAKARD